MANIKHEVVQTTTATLSRQNMGKMAADMASEILVRKLEKGELNIPLDGFLSAISKTSIGKSIVEAALPSLKTFIADNVNTMVAERAEGMVSQMIDSGVSDFTQRRICDLLRGRDEQIGEFCDAAVGLYRKTISEELPNILATVNISAIVEDRVNEMDMNETEKLVLEVMDKELKTIEWFGALLGALIGALNGAYAYLS